MEDKTIFGITHVSGKYVNWNEVFSQTEYGDETYYITKKTYEHREDGLNFDYKFALVALPTEVYTDEYKPGSINYALNLVLMPHSLSKERLDDVLNTSGLSDEKDYYLENEELLIPDIDAEGYCVLIGSELIEGEHNDEGIATKAANVVETINSLIGFYLDKPWNAIGTTGWDVINHCVNNEKLFKF